MKRSTEYINCAAGLVFHAAATCWFFCLSYLNFEFRAMSLALPLLCAALLAAYALDVFMLTRGTAAPIFAAAQLLFVAGGAFLYVKTTMLEPYVLRTVIINCVIYCVGFITAAYMAGYGQNKNGMLIRFDMLTVMMILLLLLDNFKDMPAFGSALAMCGAALAVLIVSRISERAGRFSSSGSAVHGSAAAGRIMIGVALAFVLLLTGAIVLLAFSGVEELSKLMANIITAVYGAVTAVLRWLYHLLESLLLWLSSFAGDVAYESIGESMQETMPEPEIEYGELVNMPRWIVPALIALGVAVFVYILFRLRKKSVSRVLNGKRRRIASVSRQSGFSAALAALFAGMAEALIFRVNCLRYRKTAPGLLVYCEKKAGRALAREKGESGEKYLLRLASREGCGEYAPALKSLAAAVEKSFYSPHPEKVSPELYSAIRKVRFT